MKYVVNMYEIYNKIFIFNSKIYYTVNRLRSFQSLGHLITRSLGHLATWPLGHWVTRSLAHLVTRSLGHLVTWSLGHLVTRSMFSMLRRTEEQTTSGSPGLLRRQ